MLCGAIIPAGSTLGLIYGIPYVSTVPYITQTVQNACAPSDLVLLTSTDYAALTSPSSPTSPTTAAPVQVVVTVQPYRATPDDYQAMSLIFGVVLLAAVLITGTRRVLELFRKPSEH